ncbi:hypothetical protein [Solidesulfovibrio alcoholivorans]|uniref:hypothetical protein n=1 Tax=Solidesulfovibrio alcoholivorans TaxID=81406 RepID=UPI000A02E8B6|nr:hypothetical protein [Solidesulfovibrio alcoholivorans]
MKNIQIIDGAINCTYDIFSATESEFRAIFPNDTDIEFNDELYERLGERLSAEIFSKIWSRKINKKVCHGIHGTIFYGIPEKKKFYPTRKENEMIDHIIE